MADTTKNTENMEQAAEQAKEMQEAQASGVVSFEEKKTEKENKRNSSGSIHPDKLRDAAGIGISHRILCRNRGSGGSSRRNHKRAARPDLTGSSLYQRGGT